MIQGEKETKFFYLRHAQTEAHVKKLVCGGDWDLPLSQAGVEQASEAAERYSRALSEVDNIHSSPLLRARQTAEIFSRQLNVPIQFNEELREWRLGGWEKKPWDDVPNLFARTDDPPNGETRAHFEKRLMGVLPILLAQTNPSLVIAHGAVWFGILKLLKIAPLHVPSCLPFRFKSTIGALVCESCDDSVPRKDG